MDLLGCEMLLLRWMQGTNRKSSTKCEMLEILVTSPLHHTEVFTTRNNARLRIQINTPTQTHALHTYNRHCQLQDQIET